MRTYDTRPMSRPPADSRSAQSSFVLDAVVLAHGGLSWEHEFRGVRFERLADVALSAEPVVQTQLQFGLYEQRPIVDVAIKTDLQLTCQRCLQPVQQHVDEQVELMLVDSEDNIATVPEQFDPWLVNATHANVFELVEEQLLLALPLIARHEDVATCEKNLATAVPDVVIEAADDVGSVSPASGSAAGSTSQAATVQTPFSQLRDLMRKQ